MVEMGIGELNLSTSHLFQFNFQFKREELTLPGHDKEGGKGGFIPGKGKW